ncbi:MAG: SH3 domain-containing protein [bacterium]
MSRYADKLFWIAMAIIVLVIAFLSYITFFYQTSPMQSTADENKLVTEQNQPREIRNLFICADEATIMSLPKENSQTVKPARKGEQIAIVGEEKDWFEVKIAEDKTGWIEKKYVCDHPPKEEAKPGEAKPKPVKQEPKPQPPKKAELDKSAPIEAPPDYPAGTAESMETLVDGLFERINARTQMQFGQALFEDHTVLDSGMRLEVRATGIWKALPQNSKAQVLQILSNQYTLIACNIARVANCTPSNTPTISVIDATGHEIAYQNSSGTQILE